jgi:hypothetical protein
VGFHLSMKPFLFAVVNDNGLDFTAALQCPEYDSLILSGVMLFLVEG